MGSSRVPLWEGTGGGAMGSCICGVFKGRGTMGSSAMGS